MSTIRTTAEAFWDGHHQILDDPNFWMAIPVCRRAINRRITGDPNVWPLEALARLPVANHPFRRVLSLGCGTGSLERSAMKIGMCVEIEGLDSSEASLAVAREKARGEDLGAISYRRGDLNDLRLPRRSYDLVIFHQSLHHVSSIEKLLSRVGQALAEDGILAMDEWTGPSRDEWDRRRLARLSRMFSELPDSWRRWPQLKAPIEYDDPSEAVRSSGILPAVRRLFHVFAERPYGGHIVPILLSQMAVPKVPKDDLERFLAGWLAIEDADLERDPDLSYHTVLVARRRFGGVGPISRTARLLNRFRSSAGAVPGDGQGPQAAEACDTPANETMGLFQRVKAGSEEPLRLHIGCGQQSMSGWINIDNQALPGVDRVLDVRKGLPFRGASAIYAEHFLEHIGFDEALSFLKDCRRALADSGVLRISTPNLDWVFVTHYPSFPSGTSTEKLRDCFQMNQAFHGWGHQFLYNSTMLEAILKAAGFGQVIFQRYGVSEIPDLNGIERHQTCPDTPELPHVLIAEASGRGREEPLPSDLLQNFHVVISTR